MLKRILESFDGFQNLFDQSLLLANDAKKLFSQCPKLVKKSNSKFQGDFESLDESGAYLGLKIKETSKTLAYFLLRNFELIELQGSLHLPELGLNLHFDKHNILKEISIEGDNKSSIVKGLKIGDSIEKAFKLYGYPKFISQISATWNNFTVTTHFGIISSIRIQ